MAGFILDLFFGDPAWIYHPIRIIGHLISGLEKKLYKEGTSPESLRRRGTLLWIGTAGIATLVPCLLLWAAFQIHPVLYFLLQSFWCWQLLATKSLKTESMKVKQALDTGTIEDGRKAVSMIVGRDTKSLTEEGVVKAAVETVAENTSDGIIAPLFYMMIGGAGLGFFYKAVNTMDSMVGYKNDRYLDFGRTAARMDDLFNLIPARLSAFLMIGAAGILGLFDSRHYSMANAWKIYKRDRHNHKSPNAARPNRSVRERFRFAWREMRGIFLENCTRNLISGMTSARLNGRYQTGKTGCSMGRLYGVCWFSGWQG